MKTFFFKKKVVKLAVCGRAIKASYLLKFLIRLKPKFLILLTDDHQKSRSVKSVTRVIAN